MFPPEGGPYHVTSCSVPMIHTAPFSGVNKGGVYTSMGAAWLTPVRAVRRATVTTEILANILKRGGVNVGRRDARKVQRKGRKERRFRWEEGRGGERQTVPWGDTHCYIYTAAKMNPWPRTGNVRFSGKVSDSKLLLDRLNEAWIRWSPGTFESPGRKRWAGLTWPPLHNNITSSFGSDFGVAMS